MFSSALGKDGVGDANARAEAVIDGFYPGAFSGVVLSKQLRLRAGIDTLAGHGTGADTAGTARTYNIGSVLPDGALLQGYMVNRAVSFDGTTSLDLQVGVTGDIDSICDACDLMDTAGHTQGTPGDAFTGVLPEAPQLLATLTPDGGKKVSEATDGDAYITVFYVDAT